MNILILDHESVTRFGFFLGVLAAMAVWEMLAPRRIYTAPRAVRWFNNLGLAFFGTLLLRLLSPMTATGIALYAGKQGLGLLNNVALPPDLALVMGVVALDFIIYLQHVLFHRMPVFWRLHMVHHTDLAFDATTGIRFHPIEIFLSMVIKMATVMALGASALAVLIFEILLNATSLFNHGNVRLPLPVDRVLRLILVTPDMPRVHHSVVIRELNSNFGFNLPWWDRLFGTYRGQPGAGHEGMVIGLSQFRDAGRLSLPWLLALPFLRAPKVSSGNTLRRR